MEEAVVIKTLLLSAFLLGGALLILLGLLIWRRLWDCGSVEVPAECVDLNIHTEMLGTVSDRTYFPNSRRPVYRYRYEGQEYCSSPLLSSNRSGYEPALGRCTIRINPEHPEKVYSPERKFAALVLIGIGSMWIVVAALALILLPV